MDARVEKPRVQVLLHKTIRRTAMADGVPVSGRFASMPRQIDLTPFIGDGGYVRTQKGTREPGGGWQLVLVDKPKPGKPEDFDEAMAPGSFETLYGLVEPMDVVEIRMGRNPGPLERLPLVMRGFVSEVGRSEGMGQDGKPQRQVNISGQDYGKLWQQLEIHYLPSYVVGQDAITSFKRFEKFGGGFETAQPGGKFLQEVFSIILNPYITRMIPRENTRLPREIQIDTAQLIKHGTTSITATQNAEGSLHSILARFLDVGPWNELFVEDREDGVWCVCRPNPFKTLDGKMIVSDAVEPPTVEILDDDVVSMNLTRSDAQVANYFWVSAQRFDLNTTPIQRQAAATGAASDFTNLTQYQNTSANLFGIKPMMVGSEMGNDGETSFSSGLPEAENNARAVRVGNWQDIRRRQLVLQNRDNVVLESGLLRVRGNAAIRAGIYLRVRRGTFFADYYVTRVQQDFIPYQGWHSNVFVERGTGFAKRAGRGGGADSPYLAELRK